MFDVVLALALLLPQSVPYTVAQTPTGAQAWPPETSVRAPLNALEYPTVLEPVNRSLAALLDDGAKVVSAYVGEKGPIVTVQKRGKVTVCLVIGPDPSTDQNVPTSRCYNLN
ncbi:hypothetical protein [Brevundimonas mediterranea]|uniref:Uncharacterized protein n=1 Tax=Brevundimonas mediterranea TaxID=74329 RepID=A0A7W6A1B0_9CAUL|nr:hypothetical protein [Brevundimonas mediterranea]MBB3870829.1 hypothetical protein [Brevundimonas mediterranea]